MSTISKNSIIGDHNKEEYISHVTSLKYLPNKNYFLLDSTPRIPNGILNILPHIESDQYPYYITKDAWYIQITLPNNKYRIIRAHDYGLNHNPIIHEVCLNKNICSEILSKHNIKTTKDVLLPKLPDEGNKEAIISQLMQDISQLEFPIIIKPSNGSKGKNITKLFNTEQLKDFIEDYYHERSYKSYIAQSFVEGKDYRILYYKGEVWIAYERILPFINGDGVSCIAQLIEPTTAHWVDSEAVVNYIIMQGYTLDTILPLEQQLNILPNANVSTGADTRIITHEITERDIQFLNNIAHILGAEYFGIDIISTGSIADGLVLEINHKPGISGVSGAPEKLGVNHEIGAKIRAAIKQSEGIID